MPIVHFKDASGREWEVMEVRPSSTFKLAVTEGRESGWLAFKHGDERRRLAPIPDGWQDFDAPTLDALRRAARRVEQARGEHPLQERRRVPRPEPETNQPAGDSVHVVAVPGPSRAPLPPELQSLTQEAARAARANEETVVSGLLSLRRLLGARNIAPDSDTFRAARQVFLEVYYFRG